MTPDTFDPSTFRFNSPLGKRILAVARGGDHAHPGEEEAIRRTLEPLAAAAGGRRRWLDAGCGRGGTADFVTRAGWAEVTAFDMDDVSIAEARARYPAVTFHACTVADAPRTVPGPFDLVYLFNAFYAFPDQPGALRALRELAAPEATLVIFDYVDRGGFRDCAFAGLPEARHWRPLDAALDRGAFRTTGWDVESVEVLDREYARWYEALVSRLDQKRPELEAFAPAEAIAYARRVYGAMLDAVREGVLGGAIVRARAI